MNDHTRPEMAAERHICSVLKAKILRDPCRYCIHRHPDTAWDRTFCKVDGRTWWTCRDGKTQPTFELDQNTIGDAT